MNRTQQQTVIIHIGQFETVKGLLIQPILFSTHSIRSVQGVQILPQWSPPLPRICDPWPSKKPHLVAGLFAFVFSSQLVARGS